MGFESDTEDQQDLADLYRSEKGPATDSSKKGVGIDPESLKAVGHHIHDLGITDDDDGAWANK